MIDPATVRLALKLQLDDVNAILKALPTASTDPAVISEVATFRCTRAELSRRWQEVHGLSLANNILREENANRETFKRLQSEEQQAQRDHDMACRLAGVPVPQRAAPSNKRPAADEPVAAGRDNTLKKPRTDIVGTKTAPPPTGAAAISSNKRPAEAQLTPETNAGTSGSGTTGTNYKRPQVDDGLDETLLTFTPSKNKRTAYVDPATLREDEDGRTKRPKTEGQEGQTEFGLDGVANAAAPNISILPNTGEKGKGMTHAIDKDMCSSCLELHPSHDVLQLACDGGGEPQKHAYCRDCLRRLYETSVTDPSHFPPRCCSRIIPLFSCIPFLSQSIIVRFVARREELETANRTYCSNTKCSRWIRPANTVANVASCQTCPQKTCATCKKKEHVGLCLEDKDVKELMTVARQKRWQTCPNCKEMVELNKGCYHITCRCRYEFCYLCVAKWQTCKCPLWHETNIINPQGRAVAPAPAVAPAQAQAQGPHPALAAQLQAAGNVPRAPMNPAPAPAIVAAPHAYNVPAGHPAAQEVCRHDFERYYSSMGWDTQCRLCDSAERTVNCCLECGLHACRYCTKYHT